MDPPVKVGVRVCKSRHLCMGRPEVNIQVSSSIALHLRFLRQGFLLSVAYRLATWADEFCFPVSAAEQKSVSHA